MRISLEPSSRPPPRRPLAADSPPPQGGEQGQWGAAGTCPASELLLEGPSWAGSPGWVSCPISWLHWTRAGGPNGPSTPSLPGPAPPDPAPSTQDRSCPHPCLLPGDCYPPPPGTLLGVPAECSQEHRPRGRRAEVTAPGITGRRWGWCENPLAGSERGGWPGSPARVGRRVTALSSPRDSRRAPRQPTPPGQRSRGHGPNCWRTAGAGQQRPGGADGPLEATGQRGPDVSLPRPEPRPQRARQAQGQPAPRHLRLRLRPASRLCGPCTQAAGRDTRVGSGGLQGAAETPIGGLGQARSAAPGGLASEARQGWLRGLVARSLLLGAQPSRNKVSVRTRLLASCWVLGQRPCPQGAVAPVALGTSRRMGRGEPAQGGEVRGGQGDKTDLRGCGAQCVGGRPRSCNIQALSCLLHAICQGPRRVVLSGQLPVGAGLSPGAPQPCVDKWSGRARLQLSCQGSPACPRRPGKGQQPVQRP